MVKAHSPMLRVEDVRTYRYDLCMKKEERFTLRLNVKMHKIFNL